MALTDRAISIVTVIVLGGIFYAVSPLVRRAHGAARSNGGIRRAADASVPFGH